ncbi:glucose-6-phosphate exchanger SLC37A4-like [Asterias rubens]|uniref:glucose-6-phosphate exchanger SLC37A4-like n=1 Tax=Asterias rubens TaxID=7604 RepID=UPI0014558566|nr:glucose-6-phosphate exchanger SLC37A4-like [Asterias rubens]XP_033646642.1 glucose-6-phosphate exchanger SLC37A4-like [Asterias rubens]XP_033646643.1 glucose-6-phosphate exchanger SLC37A4-like [Asterias rubens]
MASYMVWRSSIYSTLFVGYFLYYLNRKSFSFLMPYVIEEEGMNKSELGAITSSISLAYTISKFASGILSDKLSARVMFSTGLMIASLLVLQFTSFNTMNAFMIIMFLNGLAQGGGWPGCSKILKKWFLPSELGLWWSVLSTSANLAGVLGPICLAVVAKDYGWRGAMNAGAILGIVWAVVSFLMIKNSPEDVGLQTLTDKDSQNNKVGPAKVQSSATTRDIIASPFLWIVSILFLLNAHISYGIMDWGQLFLIQEVGFDNTVGSAFMSSYSIGAIVGSIASGYVTDKLIARASKQSKGSPRFIWFLIMEAVNLLFIHMFRTEVNLETSQVFLLLISFVMGVCQYSCFSVYGVVAIENAPAHLSGTSHAFAGMACNVGVLLAGFPLTYLAEMYNWGVVLMYLEIMSLASVFLLIVTRNADARIGKSAKKLE